jgi:signal transduction histidine kinase/DNA-binding transcriptional MerR regulator
MASAHFSYQDQSPNSHSSVRSRLRLELTLEKLCAKTGVPCEDLIAWEDRYGLIGSRPGRDTRHYAPSVVEDVTLIRDLLHKGIPIEHVRAVWKACNTRAGATTPPPPSHFTEVIREIEVTLTRAAQQGIDVGPAWLAVLREVMELVLIAFEVQLAQCHLMPICGEGALVTAGGEELGASRHFSALAQRAMAEQRPYVRESVSLSAYGELQTLAVPLRVNESACGALIIAWTEGQLTIDACHVALTIAQQLARAVAYARLARSDAWHLERVLECIPQPAIVQDIHRRVIGYNDEALDLASNRRDILDAKQLGIEPPRPHWLTRMPEGHEPSEDELPSTRAITTGALVKNVHLNLLDHPEDDLSTARPTLASAAPLYGRDGHVQGVLVLVNDFTTALERETRITTLTRQIAHEARGPVTAMRMRAQLSYKQLMKLPDHLHNDVLRKCLSDCEQIVDNTRRFESMLEQIISVKTWLMGKPETLSLVEVVRAIVSEQREASGTQRLAIDLDSGDTVLAGRWVRSDIESIVRNLIANALKYSLADTLVTVKLERGIDHSTPVAHLSVIDHGFGIPPEDITRIFDEGFRGATLAQDRDIPGYGVGLNVCRRLVQSYPHGRIWPESEGLGHGATFHVMLPLAQPSGDEL